MLITIFSAEGSYVPKSRFERVTPELRQENSSSSYTPTPHEIVTETPGQLQENQFGVLKDKVSYDEFISAHPSFINYSLPIIQIRGGGGLLDFFVVLQKGTNNLLGFVTKEDLQKAVTAYDESKKIHRPEEKINLVESANHYYYQTQDPQQENSENMTLEIPAIDPWKSGVNEVFYEDAGYLVVRLPNVVNAVNGIKTNWSDKNSVIHLGDHYKINTGHADMLKKAIDNISPESKGIQTIVNKLTGASE